jgi:hypothetical protein
MFLMNTEGTKYREKSGLDGTQVCCMVRDFDCVEKSNRQAGPIIKIVCRGWRPKKCQN